MISRDLDLVEFGVSGGYVVGAHSNESYYYDSNLNLRHTISWGNFELIGPQDRNILFSAQDGGIELVSFYRQSSLPFYQG